MKLGRARLATPLAAAFSLVSALLFAARATYGEEGPAAARAAPDPLAWPESQRAFLQDGPGLLLSAEERGRFASLDEPGRAAFVRDFLARDPIPETPANELVEGIAARLRLAAADYGSPQDVRAQLTFLLGRPAEKKVLDCAVAFKPLEVWTYRNGDLATELVLYRPSSGDPYRLWIPLDSKRALYTGDMEFWLDQWEQDRGFGKRVDVFFCADAELIDQVTGIEGLRGKLVATATRTTSLWGKESTEERQVRWVRPNDRAALLAAPKDLATWSRAAAATPLPAEPKRLALGDLSFDFPRWRGSRLIARGLLTLPLTDVLRPIEADGKSRLRLVVEGLLDQEGVPFDEFRVRYRLPAPPAASSGTDSTAPGEAALLFERQLRPGQAFVLRLKVKDEGSGAEGTIVRAFRVPPSPVARPKAGEPSAGDRAPGVMGETEGMAATGPDRVVLLPPPDEILLGVWRADAIVTGERIHKVVFSVDGEAQLSRTRAPFSAELRLPLYPHETVVRAEGFDDQGGLLASDQVVLNRTQGGFHVLITDPKLGRRVQGRVKAQAEVTVPEERRVESVEFRVNNRSIGTLHSPPWVQEIEVPERETLAYLTVVARLDDGTTSEGVRVLRAPANFSEVNVELVEVYASVLGGDGHPVLGLQASDFELFEAGKRRPIARFEEVGNLPLSIGIALDSSFSMASSIGEAKRAAASFLTHLVTPRDRVFALTFGGRPDMLVPLVDDAGLVSDALEKVKAFGRTALYDGVVSALYLFRAQPGQRALVLLTDGEDTVSGTSWEDALAYAERSGVAVYAVGIGLSEIKRGSRGELSDLAAATGGRAFFISRADELASVYAQIEDELRSRYLLVYSSDRAPDSADLRQVEVRSRRGRVRASRGAAR